MKDLANKIREAAERDDAQIRCALVAQLYERIDGDLKKISMDMVDLEVNVGSFDPKLDELELICDELLKILNPELQKVLNFLKPRFEAHMYRHENITWEQVEKRLREADPKKLWSLCEMERTGGEPDVTGYNNKTGELIFQDRSSKSPIGRRNCVYDKDGEEQLKRDYPDETCNGNAVDMAAQMGVDLLDENEYREAQKVDKLDQEGWSWLKVPISKRRSGVALRGMFREGVVYVRGITPDNPSENAGWRGSLKI